MIAWANGNEVSIGYYSYTDSRTAAAGDMWVAGGNCWGRKENSFSIGTIGKGACLNIASDGTVLIQYNLTVSGNLVVAGAITSPFWLAGKVNSNGLIQANKGRYIFTCTRVSTGLYTITPPVANPSEQTYYIVKITCQNDGTTPATVRVVQSSTFATSFQIMTHVNNVLLHCIFHFTVID